MTILLSPSRDTVLVSPHLLLIDPCEVKETTVKVTNRTATAEEDVLRLEKVVECLTCCNYFLF
jgi:hypothetical protein